MSLCCNFWWCEMSLWMSLNSVSLKFRVILVNRPFYSCLLSDLAIEVTLFWYRPHCCCCVNVHLHDKTREVCIKTRSPPALLPFKGQITEQATVKWSIALDTMQRNWHTSFYLFLTLPTFVKCLQSPWSFGYHQVWVPPWKLSLLLHHWSCYK